MSDRYTHGHHQSVLRSHLRRSAKNSAAYLLEHLREGDDIIDIGCGPGNITVDLARLVAPGRALGIDETDGISLDMGEWRFNLRSSNTEPVVRLNMESRGQPLDSHLAAITALLNA